MKHFYSKLFVVFLFIFITQSTKAQMSIDGTMPFMGDPAKKYSLYIPSSYDGTTPYKMFTCLHPFNTSRWDAQSWRDTLINFAETNQLILTCPDGGVDGDISDPIDTAFITTLIDSVRTWYLTIANRNFLMGFSMGGHTTYMYGLNNPDKFKGLLAIGAVNTYFTEYDSYKSGAWEVPVYLIHGQLDNPNVRYYPALDTLDNEQACVESNFLIGVGHTMDFSNRDEYLKDAFIWLDTTLCEGSSVSGIFSPKQNVINIELFPQPTSSGKTLNLAGLPYGAQLESVRILGLDGSIQHLEALNRGSRTVALPQLASGIYLVEVLGEGFTARSKLMIQD